VVCALVGLGWLVHAVHDPLCASGGLEDLRVVPAREGAGVGALGGGVLPLLLEKQRTLRALTQAELAERAGVTTATVARIERGEIEPRMTTLRKLASGLGVDPAELVGE
jgi:DNA-binding XRE family transcriptional regulator